MRILRNKKALVSGAASGIGRAIALRLAGEGTHLFLVDIDQPGVAETAAEARRAGVEVITRRCDLAEPQDVSSTVAEVLSRWNGVDILVNNAGITRDGMMHRMTKENWDAVLRTNLDSVFNMTRLVIEGMRSRGFGRIVSISSINGRKGQVGQANYSAAKAGLLGFTKAVAQEGAGRGITANVIAPGYIATEMVQAVPKEVLETKILPHIPVGRLGSADEVARCVVFLVAEEAGFITGACLDANGGQYMA
jgi:acetoacetyl-CoA reductase